MRESFFYKSMALFCMVAVLTTQSGCYISKGLVPDTSAYPEESQFTSLGARAKLSVSLDHSWRGESTEDSHIQRRVKDVAKVSEKVFEESGLFESVGFEESQPDLLIHFDIKEEEKGSETSAMLTGASLFLIPAKTGADFDLKVTVKSRSGQILGQYESKGDFNAILQLIFIIPIGWRFSVPNQVYESMFKDILIQINRDRSSISAGV